MDTAFLTGTAAFLSAILIFCGSVFLLLMLIVGARLAYFITASITLAFVLIMGVVWSINPLGPVGQLPEWDPIDIAEDAEQLSFGPASQYPEGEWRAANEDDAAELARAAELEGDASDVFEARKERLGFDPTDTIVVVDDTTKLITLDGEEYGATTFEVSNAAEEAVGEVVAVLKYDPGNPLGKSRMITAGTFIVFVAHLFGLSHAERKARQERPEGVV